MVRKIDNTGDTNDNERDQQSHVNDLEELLDQKD